MACANPFYSKTDLSAYIYAGPYKMRVLRGRRVELVDTDSGDEGKPRRRGRAAAPDLNMALTRRHYVCLVLWVGILLAYFLHTSRSRELTCQADPSLWAVPRIVLNLAYRHTAMCQAAIMQEATVVTFVFANIFGMSGLFGYFLRRNLGNLGNFIAQNIPG